MSDLTGRVALVTGAARGIGRATALRLAGAGAAVVVTDLNAEDTHAAAGAILAQGGDAMALVQDVVDEVRWDAVMEAVRERYGRLDVLVNNAGIAIGKDTEEMTMDEFRLQMAINCQGPFLGTKAALPLMKETAQTTPQGGSIVNLSSAAGLIGFSFDPCYSMTKGGVRLLTKAQAMEFARKGYRIRVNSVHPAVVDTPMGQVVVERTGQAAGIASDNEARAMTALAHPVGRLGLPEEIADGIMFLASDASGFMTGTELVMDGGLTAQ